MPDLDRSLFLEEAQLSTEEWSQLAWEGAIGEPESFLERFGWDGQAAGCVSLDLSNDNKKITAARIMLAGSWGEEPIRLQANKLWPKAAQNVSLVIDLSNLAIFKFGDGEMASDLISGDRVMGGFVETTGGKDGIITSEREKELGVGQFCLRAVASLGKSSGPRFGVWLQVTILIFPGSDDTLLEVSPLAVQAAWPGIKAGEGEMPMLPAAGKNRELFGGKAWGCPVAPAITAGKEGPRLVTGRDISAAVGSLLNAGTVADGCLTAESLKKKWEKLVRSPKDLKQKKAEKTWPGAGPAAADKGRKKSRIHVENCLCYSRIQIEQ